MSPLREEFGLCGENYENIQRVLDGTYVPPPGTDPYTIEFIRELAMPDSIREKGPMDTSLTPEENRKAWESQKGGTASDETTLSFEHYKAACLDDDLNAVDTLLRDIPLTFGFAPPSWLSITDVEILKKLGVYDIEQMRAVQLFAAEFNITNKMIGKRALANAEICNEVADEQHGSRKNHQARLLVLNKVLVGDWLLLRKQAGAYGMNDAKGCFDRIVHTVAIIVLMSFGVPYLAAKTLFLILAKARHKIKTGYGISDWVYGDEEIPISGCGQGNGLGPALWALISTKVIKMCERAGHGTTCIAPLSGKLLKFLGFAFVDDADLSECAEDVNTTGEELVSSFHRFMNRWNGGLRATGGLIAAAKTRWFLIDFAWTGTDYVYRKIADMPGDITLPDQDGKEYTVSRAEVSTAFESLGVWLALDGNQEKQKKVMIATAHIFASQISSSKCSRNDALYTYNNSFMASIQYPMIATQFSEKEWNKIIQPALQATLNSAGLVKNFPHKVLYGPELYQGMDLKHPFFLQEIAHIMTHVQEAVCQSQTGQMLQMCAEAFRVEIGIPFSLNDTPYDAQRYGFYTPDCWYKSLWKFVSNSEFNIEICEDYPNIKILRKNNKYLMEEFVRNGFTGRNLTNLNYVRKFLQAFTLADITTADGGQITMRAFECIAGNKLRVDVGWPRVPEILPAAFIELWKQALTKCFLNPYGHNKRQLNFKLEGWYDFDVEQRTWEWFFCAPEDRLYRRSNDKYEVYIPTGRRQYSYLTDSHIRPQQALTASVYDIDNRVRIESTKEFESQDLILRDMITESDRYDNLYDNCRWHDMDEAMRLIKFHPGILVDSFDMVGDEGASIAQGIKDSTARCVSDGSFKKDTPVGPAGTSAFRIVSCARQQNEQYINGYNWVTGTQQDQSAYRSEAAGVCGALAVLDVLVKHYKIETGSITIALDGMSAMEQCGGNWPLSIDQPCFDILQDIRGRLKALPIEVHFRWVEGHQGEKGYVYQRLDWWAQMNERMDKAAKQYMEDVTSFPGRQKEHRVQQLKYEKWSVSLNGTKLSAVSRDNLYTGLFGPRTLKYWQDKDNIPADPKEILWEEAKLARKKMPFGLRRIDTKVLSNCCGFALTLQRRKHQDSSACPLCEQPNEDRDHLLTCTDKRAQKQFDGSLKAYKELLITYKTEEALTEAILLIMKKHRRKADIHPNQFPKDDLSLIHI